MNELQITLPRIGAAQINLLENLSNACAVSGDEGAVRQIVLERLKTLGIEARVDALGNVLVTRTGHAETPKLRVMVAAHMDEVGFMLTDDDGEGIFGFDIVGGIDERILVGKAVWVGREKLPGVIGAKPIHLTKAGETKSALPIDSLKIDITPENAKKAKPGERATFATEFKRIGKSIYGKALDDRLGVATLLELLAHAPEGIDLLAAFTVQEEVGLRGARVAAYGFNPDVAIALDSTPAYDLPTWDDEPNTQYNTRLDAGGALYIADRATLSDTRLLRHFSQVGDEYGIPYQYRQPGGGGTDAGAMHLQREGIPSVSLSIPGRYAHTPAGLARLADWEHTLQLLYAGLCHLTPQILAQPRA